MRLILSFVALGLLANPMLAQDAATEESAQEEKLTTTSQNREFKASEQHILTITVNNNQGGTTPIKVEIWDGTNEKASITVDPGDKLQSYYTKGDSIRIKCQGSPNTCQYHYSITMGLSVNDDRRLTTEASGGNVVYAYLRNNAAAKDSVTLVTKDGGSQGTETTRFTLPPNVYAYKQDGPGNYAEVKCNGTQGCRYSYYVVFRPN